MKPNKLSFESENLVVDYISFKFQKLENSIQIKIADYLFKLGFNSYQESGKLAKPIKEPIQVNFNNKFEVLFVKLSKKVLIGRAPHFIFLDQMLSFFMLLFKKT